MDDQRILITGASGFIGSHIVDYYINKGSDILNLDIQSPEADSHKEYWIECDILDSQKVECAFEEFKPTCIIHMAALTKMHGKSIDDFSVNTQGTLNILSAIQKSPTVKRAIIVSSQHVRKPGSKITDRDDDYDPLGLYGKSKEISEEVTRQSDLNCIWTIIRPTNIWGPGNKVLANGLWKTLMSGLYYHPASPPVIRSYGYVKNSIWQIDQIINAPSLTVNGMTYYIGEAPMDQFDWVNSFSSALTNKPVKVVPAFLIYLLALLGDLLKLLKISFPMTTERYMNMTTSNPVPTKKTIDAFGVPPYSLSEGIEETVLWLRGNL